MSEPNEFISPSRVGRMRGVNITIDGETWEYVLSNAGIPIETPLSEIKIRRYRTRDGRIILKIKRLHIEPSIIAVFPVANKNPYPNIEPAKMPGNNDCVRITANFVYQDMDAESGQLCYKCDECYRHCMIFTNTRLTPNQHQCLLHGVIKKARYLADGCDNDGLSYFACVDCYNKCYISLFMTRETPMPASCPCRTVMQ